jgi:hypothetical protein
MFFYCVEGVGRVERRGGALSAAQAHRQVSLLQQRQCCPRHRQVSLFRTIYSPPLHVNISDPEVRVLNWIRIQSGPWIRIQEGKNYALK